MNAQSPHPEIPDTPDATTTPTPRTVYPWASGNGAMGALPIIPTKAQADTGQG